MKQILLVDDDAVDRELFIDAVNTTQWKGLVAEAENGEQAISILTSATALPDLIILDLNMPIKDGRNTLKELKAHDKFKSIPVCILSTSSAQFDVAAAYDSGVNLFLVKPFDYTQLKEMVHNLVTLFGKYVTLVDRKNGS